MHVHQIALLVFEENVKDLDLYGLLVRKVVRVGVRICDLINSLDGC